MIISVIVPVYNAAEHLPRCIDSILLQTHRVLEVILINDGSTDGSGEICDKYAQKDERIRVIHQENAGVSAARNAGLDAATGAWIGFVDADDWAEPDMFAKMFDAVLQSGKQIAVCGHVQHRPNGAIKKRAFPELAGDIARGPALKYLLSLYFFEGFLWNKLFSSSLIEEIGLRMDVNIHFAEDLLFCLRLFIRADGICYVPDPLYHYCLNETGSMLTFNQKRMTELDAWRAIIDCAENNSVDLAKIAKCRYTESAINIFYMAARKKQSNSSGSIKLLRKEATRYIAMYFLSHYIKQKLKIRGVAIILFPRLSSWIWSILKNRFDIKWHSE